MNIVSFALELSSTKVLPRPGDPAWLGWLTAEELLYCMGLQRAGEHLGARAMAKRAAARAIGWPHEVPWRDIEIRRSPLGRPTLAMSGDGDGWRRGHGLPVPGISMAHAAGNVAAISWLP